MLILSPLRTGSVPSLGCAPCLEWWGRMRLNLCRGLSQRNDLATCKGKVCHEIRIALRQTSLVSCAPWSRLCSEQSTISPCRVSCARTLRQAWAQPATQACGFRQWLQSLQPHSHHPGTHHPRPYVGITVKLSSCGMNSDSTQRRDAALWQNTSQPCEKKSSCTCKKTLYFWETSGYNSVSGRSQPSPTSTRRNKCHR